VKSAQWVYSYFALSIHSTFSQTQTGATIPLNMFKYHKVPGCIAINYSVYAICITFVSVVELQRSYFTRVCTAIHQQNYTIMYVIHSHWLTVLGRANDT
jgi:hypothetical protein